MWRSKGHSFSVGWGEGLAGFLPSAAKHSSLQKAVMPGLATWASDFHPFILLGRVRVLQKELAPHKQQQRSAEEKLVWGLCCSRLGQRSTETGLGMGKVGAPLTSPLPAPR